MKTLRRSIVNLIWLATEATVAANALLPGSSTTARWVTVILILVRGFGLLIVGEGHWWAAIPGWFNLIVGGFLLLLTGGPAILRGIANLTKGIHIPLPKFAFPHISPIPVVVGLAITVIAVIAGVVVYIHNN